MKKKVVLTKGEMKLGALVGILRTIENLGKPNYNPGDRNKQWKNDIEGALGELAYAKYTNKHWSAALEKGKRDVDGWEVRTTDLEEGGLIVRPWEDMTARYVLMVGSLGTYEIRGWRHGHEVMDGGLVMSKPGRPDCWVMDQKLLDPGKEEV